MRIDREKFRVAKGMTAAALICAVWLPGCAPGQGNYTSEAKEQAIQRVQGFKAGTEYDMAHQQYLSGDLDKALNSIENSIGMKNDVARSHILYARILIEKNRLEDASVSLQRALEIDDQNVDAHYFSGILHEHFSRFDEAHNYYKSAADLDPTDAQYLVAAAEMLVQQGHLDQASDLLHTHLTRFEHNPGLRQTLGHICMMQGDVEQAVQMFSDASLLAPNDEAVLEDLLRAQISATNFADAEYSLRQLLAMEGNSDRRDLQQTLARCLIELDRPVEARDILLGLTSDQKGSKDVQSWIDLANVAMLLEDNGRLRHAAGRLIAMAPHQPEGYVLRAMWLHEQGKTDEALETLALGEKRCPRAGSIAVLQGVYHEAAGNREFAVAAAQRAITLQPADSDAQRLAQRMGLLPVSVADAFDAN